MRKFRVTGLGYVVLPLPNGERETYTPGALLTEEHFKKREDWQDLIASGAIKFEGAENPTQKLTELGEIPKGIPDAALPAAAGVIEREVEVRTPAMGGVLIDKGTLQSVTEQRQALLSKLRKDPTKPFVLTPSDTRQFDLLTLSTIARAIDAAAPEFDTMEQANEFLGQDLPK